MKQKEKGKKKRKGMQYVSYDYEAAFREQLTMMQEWSLDNMFAHDRKVRYALKEIKAGDQFEVEIYPQFRKMSEVPREGQKVVKDNRAQNNLNDKNARKFVERKVNANFGDGDIWINPTNDD